MTAGVANDSYSPSWIVRQSHNLLHLDSSLKTAGNEFDIFYDNYWNSYTRSLLPIPIICGALGLIALVVFQVSLCSRMCNTNCRCLPEVSDPNAQLTRFDINRIIRSRYHFLLGTFIFFAFLAIVADQGFIYGGVSLSSAVNTGQNSLDYIHDLFVDLTNEGNSLYIYGEDLDHNLDQAAASCPGATVLQQYLPGYFTSVDDFLGYVDPVPGQCDDAESGMDRWGIYYKNCSIWVMYGVVLGTIAVYALAVEMVIVMGLGDYCMSPVLYVQNLVPRSIFDVTAYYTTCEGSNPLDSSLDDLQTFSTNFQIGLDAVNTACPDNSYVEACFPIMDEINVVLNTAVGQSACPPTQSEINDVLETGICEQGFRGIYSIWLGQYLTASFLLVSTILATLLYQYFGCHWDDAEELPHNQNNVLFTQAEVPSAPSGYPPSGITYNNPQESIYVDNVKIIP
eukprot:scaffold3058_cov165-Ochromonas_danica.AAC.50